VPTHEEADTFQRDLARLNREQRAAFLEGLAKFIHDLTAMEDGKQADFRKGLRVKRYQTGPAGVMEMTWADDGRALWKYGDEQVSGKRHVQWLRVGTHDIF